MCYSPFLQAWIGQKESILCICLLDWGNYRLLTAVNETCCLSNGHETFLCSSLCPLSCFEGRKGFVRDIYVIFSFWLTISLPCPAPSINKFPEFWIFHQDYNLSHCNMLVAIFGRTWFCAKTYFVLSDSKITWYIMKE